MDGPTQAFSVLHGSRLITTLRYDRQLQNGDGNATKGGAPTPYYMLDRHHERLVSAARLVGYPVGHELQSPRTFHARLDAGLGHLAQDLDVGPQRIRISLGPGGDTDFACQPIAAVPGSTLYPHSFDTPTAATPWAVLVNDRATAAGPATTIKQDQRAFYDEARAHMEGRYDRKAFPNYDVVLVGEQGCVLDGCITAVYFKRDGRWVTPPAGIGEGNWGALLSVTRQWALDRGLATEGLIDAASLQDKERVWLSNGARGFFPGAIVCDRVNSQQL